MGIARAYFTISKKLKKIENKVFILRSQSIRSHIHTRARERRDDIILAMSMGIYCLAFRVFYFTESFFFRFIFSTNTLPNTNWSNVCLLFVYKCSIYASSMCTRYTRDSPMRCVRYSIVTWSAAHRVERRYSTQSSH